MIKYISEKKRLTILLFKYSFDFVFLDEELSIFVKLQKSIKLTGEL